MLPHLFRHVDLVMAVWLLRQQRPIFGVVTLTGAFSSDDRERHGEAPETDFAGAAESTDPESVGALWNRDLRCV